MNLYEDNDNLVSLFWENEKSNSDDMYYLLLT